MILATNLCTFKDGTTAERIAMMRDLGFTGAGPGKASDIDDEAWSCFDLLSVHGPFIDLNLLSGMKDVREMAKKKCMECMDWSSKIGAKTVAFHPGDATYGMDEEETDEIMRNIMLEFDAYAVELDIWACWETGTGYFVPLKKFDMIRELNLKKTGICLDTGHLERVWRQISIGDEIGTFRDFIYRFKDLIKCTHIHDWIDKPVRGDGWQDHYMVGDGSIDWNEFFGLLVEIGYDGDLLLEYHPQCYDTIEDLRVNLDKLRAIVRAAGATI